MDLKRKVAEQQQQQQQLFVTERKVQELTELLANAQVWGLGFGLWALGFGLWALGFGVWIFWICFVFCDLRSVVCD